MDKIYRDILQLSSGTIATLIGENDYYFIDLIRSEFALYTRIHMEYKNCKFKTWVDAWEHYLERITRP